MNEYTHVYCTNCNNGQKLIGAYLMNSTWLPKDCDECYPWNPEDSVPMNERPKYRKEQRKI